MSNIETYIRDVKLVQEDEFLTAKEEIELAVLIGKGDISARNRLVTCNLLLVIKVAKPFAKRYPIDELISEGNEALIDAADNFDPSKKKRFTTYAGRAVKNRMIEYVRLKQRMIWVPKYAITNLKKQSKGIPLPRKATKKSIQCLKDAEKSLAIVRSEDFDFDRFVDMEIETYGVTSDELIFLSKEERQMLELHYEKEMTYADIGKLFNVSGSQIGHICQESMRKCWIEFKKKGMTPRDFVMDAASRERQGA